MNKGGSIKQVRCAIYTRVSSDAGLEQDFNSLDAQHDAAQAYIRSQAHACWTLIRTHYDDGGFSGGNTERPALQRLLADVQARKVDVIVVYKVDRLTRSLADFAKLVELFDAHNVSFVSVTQHFNTTTSMGRLTLNVLLSFAQFEREVTSERIRDKIAASKRKGLWVGGKVPLGYSLKDGKIVIVADEAERVRTIFRRYVEVGSLNHLMVDLRHRGIITKVQPLKSGRSIGGIPFTRGPLSYLLRNRFYIGEVVYKGEVLLGSQPPILDRGVFEAVQAKLVEQRNNHVQTRLQSEALLLGKIFDDRGNRMSPSHSRKQGVRYRYYISLPLLHGRPKEAGSISRAPAVEIETLVADAVRPLVPVGPDSENDDLFKDHVARVEIRQDEVLVQIRQEGSGTKTVRIPWHKQPAKRRREILLPSTGKTPAPRPIRADARGRLVAAVARGRRWLDELISGAMTNVDQIAIRERCSVRRVNMTLTLAFLAPDLVSAAIEGRLPRGVGIARLCELPASWSQQFQALGIAQP